MHVLALMLTLLAEAIFCFGRASPVRVHSPTFDIFQPRKPKPPYTRVTMSEAHLAT